MNKGIEDVKEYWNRNPVRGRWKGYEEELSYVQRKEDWMYNLIDNLDVKGKRVLDLGCGPGLNTYYLHKSGAIATGADISEESVKIANERFAAIGIKDKCIIANAEDLKDFKDNSFDIVISLGVLHHTPNMKKAAKEVYRILKPGGKIGMMLYRKYSFQFLIINILRRMNRNNWMYSKNTNNKKRYRTFFTEMLTCPITRTYSARQVRHEFSNFSKFRFEPVHTGITRIIDFFKVPKWLEHTAYNLDLVLKPIFGCYLTFYATKKK
jgi:ubiquinone/menaquinone biosynthesis C-methylase UbiE